MFKKFYTLSEQILTIILAGGAAVVLIGGLVLEGAAGGITMALGLVVGFLAYHADARRKKVEGEKRRDERHFAELLEVAVSPDRQREVIQRALDKRGINAVAKVGRAGSFGLIPAHAIYFTGKGYPEAERFVKNLRYLPKAIESDDTIQQILNILAEEEK